MAFERQQTRTLRVRLLQEPRRFLQVVAGPRQVGKTTLVRQVLGDHPGESVYASADEPGIRNRDWLVATWNAARLRSRETETVLALDEIQKIPGWSEAIKALWDQDTASKTDLRVVILGSAPLLIQNGLTESLAGRFETIRLGHWSFPEMRDAFGFTLDQFVFFGGYPGAAPLISDETRWSQYVRDSLIETTISRDVMLMHQINKPALLRQVFNLGTEYSSRILSYQKMMGQLQDAGNTTTLAHYLDLLRSAGMVAGIQKYAGEQVRKRGSSPKLQVFNTALISATAGVSFSDARNTHEDWGRLVESVVGAHLLNLRLTEGIEVYYWRNRGDEVDFIVESGGRVIALEVKSGKRTSSSGLERFAQAFSPDATYIVGGEGLSLEEFLTAEPEAWLSA